MVPVDMRDFIIACLGASASFIGLLFVGLSLVLQRNQNDPKLEDNDRILAESSYAALINIFFVSLFAIEPKTNIGYVLIILALLGVGNGFREIRQGHVSLLVLTSIIYIGETVLGVFTVLHHNQPISDGALEAVFTTLFATALARAWELIGVSPNSPSKKRGNQS